ncbi:beta-1,3-galactosyltransferase 5-like [Glandiceps talaboti]
MNLEKVILIVAIIYIVNIIFYVSFYFRSSKDTSSSGVSQSIFFGPGGRNWFIAEAEDVSPPQYNNTNNLTGSRVNLDVYHHIINQPDTCIGRDVFILGLVTTAPQHVKERKAIRDTWASVKQAGSKRIVSLFLVAKTEDQRLTKLIRDEGVKYKDILQFDFDEHYLNLTLKTLLGFRWATKHCPNATYVLKTDDDVFVNYYSLAKNLTNMPRSELAYGYAYYNITPSRNHTNKWFTPWDMYKEDKFPSYLVGTGYLLSKDLVRDVNTVSKKMEFISWEDVFVGIALNKLQIPLIHDWRFDTFSGHTRLKDPCTYYPLFTSHHKNPLRLRYMWKMFMKHSAECEKKLSPVPQQENEFKVVI